MNLDDVKRITIDGKVVKQIVRNNSIVWRLPTSNLIPLVVGEWSSYGLSVSADSEGIITFDGTPNVTSAAFIRLSGTYMAAVSSTGLAETEDVFIPAGVGIRFGVEWIDGSYTQVANAMNIVLRDRSNIVQFNCMLGDNIWSQEGSVASGISCLSLYIRRTVTCTALRIRPYVELL